MSLPSLSISRVARWWFFYCEYEYGTFGRKIGLMGVTSDRELVGKFVKNEVI